MKQKTIVLLTLLLLLPLYVFTQDRELRAERVAVVPFVNSTDTEQWDNLALAMAETIELTLKLSGQFQIVDVESSERIDPYAPDGPLVLRDLAEALRLDAAIIGRITPGRNGRVELEAAAYSAITGEIVGAATREAFGSFDILDAADELVVLAASAFLGYEVGFGGVILKPSRPDVPYKVYVDGIDVGTSIRSLPQILTGRRTLEIALLTSRGEQYVYSADRLIRPGEAIEVPFGLPAVTSAEQQKIRAGHAVAEELLGRPDQFMVAFRALRESRTLLMDSTSDALAPFRQRQRILETVWQLEEELYRLRPENFIVPLEYVPGDPFVAVQRSREILGGDDGLAGEDEVASRLLRNGAGLYHYLHIARSAALGRGDWDGAAAILDDMEEVARVFDLDQVTSWRQGRADWRRAQNESESYARRSRRPWPYIGLAAGLGGVGYGGYILATDEVGRLTDKGDDYYEEYEAATTGVDAEEYREKAEDQYDRAETTQIIQWSSIAVGGVVAVLSVWRIRHNRRAADRFLIEWAGDRYGQEIALSDRMFSRRFVDATTVDADSAVESSGVATVLVLGPSGEVVRVDGQPRVFPFLQEVPVGQSLDVDRAPIVDADRTRIYDGGFSVLVLQ
jgi:TolB-like protein